jgi:hypothetical protein
MNLEILLYFKFRQKFRYRQSIFSLRELQGFQSSMNVVNKVYVLLNKIYLLIQNDTMYS